MGRLKTIKIHVFLLLCCVSVGVTWCQTNSVLTWSVVITYREAASDADRNLLGNRLQSSTLFNINARSELKLQVGDQSLIAEAKLPFQLEPPRKDSSSKVAFSEYYAFFDSTTHVTAYGEPDEKWPSPGETVAINEAIVRKPSENLLTVGSPTGYYISAWMPSLMFLCYLAHRDIGFIERVSGVKFAHTAKGDKKVYTYAMNNFAVRIFYHGGLPERMEIDNMGTTIRVVSEGRFAEKSKRNPYKVRYIRTEGDAYEEIVLTLKQVETLDEDPELDLPLGTIVYDYRLLGANLTRKQIQESKEKLQYQWRGRLPSEEELGQLAYQEGSLLPPETPQRRYSLWMFLPAIALFGLALLLYLRRKR